MARYSSGPKGDVKELGRRFGVLETLGQDPEREGLDAGDGFVPTGGVQHGTRQIGYLSEPPAVILALNLDREADAHLQYCSTDALALPNNALHPTGARRVRTPAGERGRWADRTVDTTVPNQNRAHWGRCTR